LLAHFEMTATGLVIANRSAKSHQTIAQFRREDDSLRSFELFAGTDTLTASGPRVIYYGGNSIPIVTASSAQFIVSEADLPTQDNPRQCACMVGWSGDKGQAIIATHGDPFHESYEGATGVRFDGIEENRRFARN